jgi:hypothetical protein
MTFDPFETFGKFGTLARIMEQEERMRNLVDPPAMRGLREALEASQKYSTALDRFRDDSAKYLLRSMEDFNSWSALQRLRERETMVHAEKYAGPTSLDVASAKLQLKSIKEFESIKDLIAPSGLDRFREAVEAAQKYSSALETARSIMAMSEFDRSAHLFDIGGGMFETLFRDAHLAREAESIRLAIRGIPKLARGIRDEAPSWQSAGLLHLGAGVIGSSLEHDSPLLVADVPAEIFRALDADVALSDTSEGQLLTVDERDSLSSATSDELSLLLKQVDSDLVALLSGARAAVASANPDRVRHVCVSLRELFGHTLRQLAPDGEIRTWSQDTSHYHEGQPTRKARLLYLYGSINASPLKKFIEADVRAAIELIDVLSHGTHTTATGISSEAIRILANRAEGILLMVLKVAEIKRGA